MASYFGEVNALSSRAVDDEEIDDQPIYNLTIDSKAELASKTDCKLLIFSVGELATAFVKSYLIPDNVRHLMDIKCCFDKIETDSIMYTGGLITKSKGTKTASIYTVDSDVIVCEISSHIPEEIDTDLCEIILQRINCVEALVLTSRHMANFKSEETLQSESPFLKVLSTSQYVKSHTCGIPRLQAPNFISGFSAAVLTDFEVKKKPALCIVNYVDSNILDSLNVQAFERLEDENFIVKLSFVSDAKSKLVKFIKVRNSVESNLYT